MFKLLVLISSVVALVMGIFFYPFGPGASMLGIIGAVITLILLKGRFFSSTSGKSFGSKDKVESSFQIVASIFLIALLLRVVLSLTIFGLDLQQTAGPDALYYDFLGDKLSAYWLGLGEAIGIKYETSGWGMAYFVAAIYTITGQNPLAGQIVIAVFGAACAPLGYLCAKEVFRNERVASYSAVYIAVFPSMIIWTSQLLKEGLIIFFLLISFLAAMRLYKRFNYSWALVLLLSLGAISTLRFYVFFIAVAAVAGGLVLSVSASAENLLNRFIVCVIIGVAFSYLGVWNLSSQQVEKFGNIERIQISREYSSRAAESGFLDENDDSDITTTEGLITAIPVGLVTLFLAPFPWQVSNLTQLMTMPEMVIWWLSLPLIVIGIVYSIRHRFRETVAILFFTLILSLSYSLYQGNLGTLYRQRVQIQVFLLIFAAVGTVLRIEKRENAKSSRFRQRKNMPFALNR